MKYETKDYAEHLVNNLTMKEVDIINMRYWHDMTFNEMGKELGVCHNGARVRLLAILKKCRGFIYREVDKPSKSIKSFETLVLTKKQN
jgi:DNA-directed RNA polymerase sigma subunit (sigma70/sigma32)